MEAQNRKETSSKKEIENNGRFVHACGKAFVGDVVLPRMVISMSAITRTIGMKKIEEALSCLEDAQVKGFHKNGSGQIQACEGCRGLGTWNSESGSSTNSN